MQPKKFTRLLHYFAQSEV